MLTEKEIQLVKVLGSCMGMFSEICGNGDTRSSDLNEVCDKIHQLQNIVLSNSAARAHPDMFRLLGGTVSNGGN